MAPTPQSIDPGHLKSTKVSPDTHRSHDTLTLEPGSFWFRDVRRIESPNCDDRPPGTDVDLVVIHNISLPPGEFETGCVERLFCNQLVVDEHPFFDQIRELRVSAHLFVSRSGVLTQFVALNRRAWHAGESCYDGREACNNFSIGIELEGTDHQAYEDRQYHCLHRVLRALFETWPSLNLARVVGHSDIAPQRKTDPGPAFDWARVRESMARDADSS